MTSEQLKLRSSGRFLIGLGVFFGAFAKAGSTVITGPSADKIVLLMNACVLVAYVICVVGCSKYARGKGRSGWWAILSFWPIIGLLILWMLPAKTAIGHEKNNRVAA